jgi:hypothetical protein
VTQTIVERREVVSECTQKLKVYPLIGITAPTSRGKSTLLQQLELSLEEEGSIVIYYNAINVYSVRTFLESYSKQIIKKLSPKLKDLFEESQRYFPKIKPEIKLNPVHGVDVRLNYDVSSSKEREYLQEVITVPEKLAKARDQRVTILLDEVHLLKELKDLDLFSLIMKTRGMDVSYVLCSSKEKEFKLLLKSQPKVILKGDAIVALGKISEEMLLEYIKMYLDTHSLSASDQVMVKICQFSEGEISFTRKILEQLLYKKSTMPKVSMSDISTAIQSIIRIEDDVFSNYFQSLSNHQKKLIIAIAKQGGDKVFSTQFIEKNELKAIPSVQTSMNGLYKKNFVIKEAGVFRILNLFFKEWLIRSFG